MFFSSAHVQIKHILLANLSTAQIYTNGFGATFFYRQFSAVQQRYFSCYVCVWRVQKLPQILLPIYRTRACFRTYCEERKKRRKKIIRCTFPFLLFLIIFHHYVCLNNIGAFAVYFSHLFRAFSFFFKYHKNTQLY